MTNRNPVTEYPSPPHYSSVSSPAQSFGRQSPMSSRSPEQYGSGSGYAQQGQQRSQPEQPDQDKGPLSLNLGFLKSLTEKRTTRDGNPQKRRGPKPDSKPALTRRQELNRQAQRTHRERKELYIKALEDEVLRLKEILSNMSQDKGKLADENKQLRQLLALNGINWSGSGTAGSPPTSNLDDVMSTGYSASSTGGYGQAFTPPLTSRSTAPSVTSSGQQHHSPNRPSHPPQPIGYATTTNIAGGQQMSQMQQQQSRGVDMDQAGIDFVLTYDDPSKAYMSPPHH
ncbi:hypothetical protein MKZ38_009283 [Zalerion maritima]|uniref:BZIP domain-containing protein n=1 Tax=Zalerion maritima TaxID=339359 RepID=A0AAD5RVC9_9PEZI|nr:hypothetical protein MKZ38_009283 [Zalerion maritima]